MFIQKYIIIIEFCEKKNCERYWDILKLLCALRKYKALYLILKKKYLFFFFKTVKICIYAKKIIVKNLNFITNSFLLTYF